METFIFSWPGGSSTFTTSDHITRSTYSPDMADLFSQITIRADREINVASLLMQDVAPKIAIQIPEIGWKGWVESCRFEQSEVQINCVGIHYAGERDLLGGKIQRHCRFALFSKECGATKTTTSRAVTHQVNPNLVAIPTGTPSINADWIGGYFVIEGETYRITGVVSSTVFNIDRPLYLSRASVEITRGCRHTAETCINKPNFGGFPTIEG